MSEPEVCRGCGRPDGIADYGGDGLLCLVCAKVRGVVRPEPEDLLP